MNYRFVIVFSMVLVCVVAAPAVNLIYGNDAIYTHFFYLPIILAGVWYPRYALAVAAALGLVHLVGDYVSLATVKSESVLRAGIFLGAAYLTVRLTLPGDRLAGDLQGSKALTADIFEFLPDATFVVDKDKKVIFWNRAMETMTGIKKADMIGQGDAAYTVPFWGERRKNLIDLLELDEEALSRSYQKITRQDNVLAAETFCPALYDGKGAYVWAVAAPLYNDQGELIGAIEAIRDITERKKLEEDLQRINQELEQFAYVASHDLRSPLRAVESLSEWLTQDLGENLPPESARHLELLRGRVRRMDQLLEDLLGFSRVGRTRAAVETVDATALVKEIADFLMLNDRFAVVADNLPVFSTWATPFRQVLHNLIGNAAKHHDKEKGRIVVEARRQNRYYEFAVEDDGPGIPEQFREKVFGMFQVLRPRDEVEGSGMGLALVKKTVEHYGGKIRLEDGQSGTRVVFTWPVNIT